MVPQVRRLVTGRRTLVTVVVYRRARNRPAPFDRVRLLCSGRDEGRGGLRQKRSCGEHSLREFAVRDRSARGVVAAIVAFAHVTGASVIAEGIEDREMLEFIDRSGGPQAALGRGISGAQGYFLRRPSATFPTDADVAIVRSLLKEHTCTDDAARDDRIVAAAFMR